MPYADTSMPLREELRSGGWDSYNPGGAVQGKAMDSAMAAKMSFVARAGHPAGADFLADKFLEQHPEYSWQKPLLKDMKAGHVDGFHFRTKTVDNRVASESDTPACWPKPDIFSREPGRSGGCSKRTTTKDIGLNIKGGGPKPVSIVEIQIAPIDNIDWTQTGAET